MTTTPLPPLPRITEDPFRYYTADQMQAHATAARADLEAENARLREALKGAANYIDTLGGVSQSYRIALNWRTNHDQL
jgi:hypothetical protein